MITIPHEPFGRGVKREKMTNGDIKFDQICQAETLRGFPELSTQLGR